MKILGVNCGGHDAGAALIIDGETIAMGEERLDRVKHSNAFPAKSIAYVLADAGLKSVHDVDMVVLPNHSRSRRRRMTHEEFAFHHPDYAGPVHTISHHEAHAASAYFCSPFDDAAVLIVDGMGSPFANATTSRDPHYVLGHTRRARELQTLYRATGTKLTRIHATTSTERFNYGLGLAYSAVARYLNFGQFGAGKVMGLAPYGKNDKVIAKPFYVEYEGDIVANLSDQKYSAYPELFGEIFCNGRPPRTNEPLPDDFFSDIAYKVQKELEEALVTLARRAHQITRSKNLCIAGGVGLNSVSNKKILDLNLFDDVFIQPACDDSGIALGCALHGAKVIAGSDRSYVMNMPYLGREYSDSEIEAVLKTDPDIQFEKLPNIVEKTAQLLADGKIVGWHQGRSEAGPRALGNRSILCDPRGEKTRDILNAKVKHREAFRPFAPTVLEEDGLEVFEIDRPSPYMLMIAPVKKDKQALLPAITHVDGTARIQTITATQNQRYYDLIHAFKQITGTPVLLNTSFNIAGDPIVETPADALECFMVTQIDTLIIGDYHVEAVRKRIPDHSPRKAEVGEALFTDAPDPSPTKPNGPSLARRVRRLLGIGR